MLNVTTGALKLTNQLQLDEVDSESASSGATAIPWDELVGPNTDMIIDKTIDMKLKKKTKAQKQADAGVAGRQMQEWQAGRCRSGRPADAGVAGRQMQEWQAGRCRSGRPADAGVAGRQMQE